MTNTNTHVLFTSTSLNADNVVTTFYDALWGLWTEKADMLD